MISDISGTLDSIRAIQEATTAISEMTVELKASIAAIQEFAAKMSQQSTGSPQGDDGTPNGGGAGDSDDETGDNDNGSRRDIFKDNSIMKGILFVGDFIKKFAEKTMSRTREIFEKGFGKLKTFVQGINIEKPFVKKILGFTKLVSSYVYDFVEITVWMGRKIFNVFSYIGGVITKGIGRLGKWVWDIASGLDIGSKLQNGYNQLLSLGKQAVDAAFERIRAEQELQKVMGNTNKIGQEAINRVERQADDLSMVTGIQANTGIVGQAQLAQYVADPEQVAALTEPMYNLATEMFGINVNTDQIKEAADLIGRAMNGEIESITRNGEKLSSFLSESDRQMYKFANEAQRAEMLIQVLNQHTEGLARSMGATPEGKLLILQGILQRIRETIGLGILPGLMGLADLLISAYSSGTFDSLINAVIGGFNMIIEAATWVVELLLNNWDMVLNALAALGIAAAVFAAIWLVQWLIAAMPVILIVAVIMVVIEVLHYFGVSTGEIMAFVAGAFMAFLGTVYNVIAVLWNLLLSFAEFLINLFIDPAYAIEKLFYDVKMIFLEFLYKMAVGVEDFAGSFMTSIIGAVNGALTAFNWLSKKINDIFGLDMGQAQLFDEDNVHAISDGIKNLMDGMQKPTSLEDVVDLSGSRLDHVNPNDLYQTGSQAAIDLSTNGLNADPFLSDKLKNGTWGTADEGGTGNIGTVNRVNSLGNIDEQVDISSEDLKVMRDLAEMKAIQNFVTLTPTVQVTTGDVRNGDDVDTMIAKIEDILTKQITSTASGVYG